MTHHTVSPANAPVASPILPCIASTLLLSGVVQWHFSAAPQLVTSITFLGGMLFLWRGMHASSQGGVHPAPPSSSPSPSPSPLVFSPLPIPDWRNHLRRARQRTRTLRRIRTHWRIRSLLARNPSSPERAHQRPDQRLLRAPLGTARASRSRRRSLLRLPTLTFTLDMVNSADLSSSAASYREEHTQQMSRLSATVTRTFHETWVPPYPTLLALHDHPRHLTLQCQFDQPGQPDQTGQADATVTAPPTTMAQRRAFLTGLRQRGITAATWSHATHLTVPRTALATLRPPDPPPLPLAPSLAEPRLDVHWFPVVVQRQTTIWWPFPLPATSHLILAGHILAPLAHLLQQATEPELPRFRFIHDPDGRLHDLPLPAELLRLLTPQPDALAQARHAQFHAQFLRERVASVTEHQASTATERQAPASSPPICLVVNPTASVWPEVSPLLNPPHQVHGVQVVLLLLGNSPPILPLRPLCHQLPVVEIAASRLTQPLLLPDTFRPANLPIPRPGQALAWMRGGSISWLGRAPALSTARHTTSFNQSHP